MVTRQLAQRDVAMKVKSASVSGGFACAGRVCRVVDLELKLTVVAPIAGIKFIPFPNKFRSITIVNDPLV